jgi:hypothetical protein
MFGILRKTVRSNLPCRPREGGDPVIFAAMPLDSRWSLPPSACIGGGNDTELLRFVASQVPSSHSPRGLRFAAKVRRNFSTFGATTIMQ